MVTLHSCLLVYLIVQLCPAHGYDFINSLPQEYVQVLLVNQILSIICALCITILLVYFIHGLYIESQDTSHPHDDFYRLMVKGALASVIFYWCGCVGSAFRSNKIVYQNVMANDLTCKITYSISFFGYAVFGRVLNDLVLYGKFYMTFRESIYGSKDSSRQPCCCGMTCCCALNTWWPTCLIFAGVLVALSVVAVGSGVVQYPIGNDPSIIWCSAEQGNAWFQQMLAIAFVATFVELTLQVVLLFLYYRRFREILAHAGINKAKANDSLTTFLRRNFVLAFWTATSSQLFFALNVISPTAAAATHVPIDSLINSICVVLIFRFASGMYSAVCSPGERCLMGLQHKSHDLAEGVGRVARALSERTLSTPEMMELEAQSHADSERPPLGSVMSASERDTSEI